MAQSGTQGKLLIFGVHLKSESYPNTLYRLMDLKASGVFDTEEINIPMWHERTQSCHGVARLFRSLWRTIFAHAAIFFLYFGTKYRETVYVPYPAIFVLFLLSWFPKRLRPQFVVADVFISVYDTVVLDRRLLSPGGFSARVLKWVEGRAYRYADRLVVDTLQSARFLCSQFGLTEEKTVAITLSINENDFSHTAYDPRRNICHVLFVGTMVPLHGVSVILEAARLLSDRADIQFRLIGDGEDAYLIESCLAGDQLPNLSWERKWQSSKVIAEEIRQADICLGIFGVGDKAQRVFPFKLYAYASMGRAIVTGDTLWFRESAWPDGGAFATVPVNDAAALAEKIVQLAKSPALRLAFAEKGHAYYQAHFGNLRALNRLVDCLSNRAEI